MSKEKISHNSKIFYGWYIVAAAFIILFFNSGARFSFGVMFKPMIAEFGWNRGLISSAFFPEPHFRPIPSDNGAEGQEICCGKVIGHNFQFRGGT